MVQLFLQVYQQAPNHVWRMEDAMRDPLVIQALILHSHLGVYRPYGYPW